jgi:hypothetical protein
MLTLEPLRQDQYRQVAEWEFGPQPEGTDWGRYESEMNQPQWAHYSVYDGDILVGCVSLEQTSPRVAAYHVVTARKRVHPQALADACIRLAGALFNQGYIAVVAHNPIDKRAGARLAIRCGMREIGRGQGTRYFVITKQRFERQRFAA